MTLKLLRTLAANLGTKESGDELVEYIYHDGGYTQSDRDFVDKYTDPVVRGSVFAGTSVGSNLVSLGTSAWCLKDALQRAFVQGSEKGAEGFRPFTAYHITSSKKVMKSILSTGFRADYGTAGGYGSYFYSEREKAENYIPAGGRPASGSILLEVTIYSNVQGKADYEDTYGGGTWANNFMGKIVTVKNPLLIVPKAVIQIPG